jgi:uncharacterized membrane protein
MKDSQPRRERVPWIVRIGRAHTRLWTSAALGVVAGAVPAVLSDRLKAGTWALVGWDVALTFYLAAAAVMMARSPAAEIRRHAAAQDEGAFAILILTNAAALASLGAIFAELAGVNPSAPDFAFYVALVIATVTLSWTFTHTIFALHYAYGFYGGAKHEKCLQFPGDDKPDYWDFIYFSFVVGMTFQVSDVAVTSKFMRRMVVAHGVVSFLFNTAIVAVTLNIVSSSISSR